MIDKSVACSILIIANIFFTYSDSRFDPDLVDGVRPISKDGGPPEESLYVKVEIGDDYDYPDGNSSENTDSLLALPASKKSFLKLERQLQNHTKIVGEVVRLKCEVTGFPPPRFRWYKNEVSLEEERSRVAIKRFNLGENKYLSRLRISKLDIFDTAYYTCDVHSGEFDLQTTGIVQVKLGKAEPPGTIPSFKPLFPSSKNNGDSGPVVDMTGLTGKCQPYEGNSVCKALIQGQSVYVLPPNTISDLDSRIMTTLSELSKTDVTETCRKFAIKIICFHAFQLCSAKNSPVGICRHDCNLLKNQICPSEYALAEANGLTGKNGVIPACKDQPEIKSIGAKNCVSFSDPPPPTLPPPPTANIGSENVVVESKECFVDQGESYKGDVSTTASGKTCLNWSKKIPDKIKEFPELEGHNKCRNPGGKEEKPWCYTDDQLKPVEVCNLSKCNDMMWMYIAIPSVSVFVFLVLICAIFCIKRRTRSRSPHPPTKPPTELPNPSSVFGNHKFMGHDVEMNSMWQKNAGPIRVREIPPSTVTYFEELGEGAFGNVYRGEVSALNMDRVVTPVVIKTLKNGANTTLYQQFRHEVEVMTDLKHPNIVCLLAVCLHDQPFCMLFEFPLSGNLHEYLMKTYRTLGKTSEKSRGIFSMDVGEFLCVSTQVASGMEYLSSQHYVHRDLAARNCLMGDNLTVKISNFGLARDTYACDYFHSPANGLLPIRWMPPEAILCGKFSTESDVWSFGVLLWEILSHGRQPYYGYSNQEVIEMVSSHQVLPCPEDSSTQVYGLMLECWADVAAKRPTFQELHLRLHSWQVLHNMGNLNSSQFFRPHSDGQYSSTGPSNRTGSTHLGSSIAAPSSSGGGRSSVNYPREGSTISSAISSQPVTVIGIDRSSSRQHPSTATNRSDSPCSHSSTTGLYPAAI